MPRAKAPERDKSEPKVERFSQSLRVELTPEEVADRADRAAQMVAERDAKEEERQAAQKHAKSVIESLDAEIRRLSNEVRTRNTYRAVECTREYLYAAGLYRETRTDTGEKLTERRLTDQEKQLELPFTEDGGGDGAD